MVHDLASGVGVLYPQHLDAKKSLISDAKEF